MRLKRKRPANIQRSCRPRRTQQWPVFAATKEWVASGHVWDSSGVLHARGAHWPLFVELQLHGTGASGRRDRGAEGHAARAVRDAKTAEYRATGVWPWWVVHPSEPCFMVGKYQHMCGSDARGQGYPGAGLTCVRRHGRLQQCQSDAAAMPERCLNDASAVPGRCPSNPRAMPKRCQSAALAVIGLGGCLSFLGRRLR